MKDSEVIGKKFNMLTAISQEPTVKYVKRFKCLCDCGKYTVVEKSRLINGVTKSCGCLIKKAVSKRATIHGDNTKKGQTRLYRIWHNMKQRCTSPRNDNYERYGGRGITYCPEWEDYCNFKNWAVNNGYRDDLFIDREDNRGPYCPENCRWVTYDVQMNNTRKNVFVEYKGERLTIAQLAKKYNLKYSTLQTRIKKLGYSVERAVETPMSGVWNGSKD